jgi:hypothetical protein
MVAMLITERALEHQNLLAEIVRVGREVCPRVIAHNRCCTSDLSTLALEHASAHPWRRAAHPLEVVVVYDDALSKICV